MAIVGELAVKIQSFLDDKGFKQASTSINKLSGWVKNNQAQFKQLGITAGIAGGAVVAMAVKSAQAAGKQQQAEFLLGQAMKQRGTFTEEAHKTNLEYASSLQKMTTAGDEDILVVMKQLTQFGLEGKALRDTTKAVLDLAAAKEMKLSAAGDLVARSIGSSTNALSRYGIEITGAASSTERAESAIKGISAIFGGEAQAQAQTYLGRVKQLSNRWGDFVEQIGFKAIPIIESLVDVIQKNILPVMEMWMGNTKDTKETAESFANVLRFLIKMAMGVADAFNIAGTGIAALFAAITGNFDVAKEGFREMATQIEESGERMKALSKENIENAKIEAEEKNIIAEEAAMQDEMRKDLIDTASESRKTKEKARINAIQKAQTLAIKEKQKQEEADKIITVKAEAAHLAEMEKLKQEHETKVKNMADFTTRHLMQGTIAVANLQKLTFSSVGQAYKDMMKNMLTEFIMRKTAELTAAKVVALAQAIFNSSITFGAAAGQIGIVLAAHATAIGALRAIPSLDEGGIVPGPPGRPVIVQALGGEAFGGRQSIGFGGRKIEINITGNYILDDEMAETLASKVGDKIFDMVETETQT